MPHARQFRVTCQSCGERSYSTPVEFLLHSRTIVRGHWWYELHWLCAVHRRAWLDAAGLDPLVLRGLRIRLRESVA
jgi:hypothetical protein